MISKVSIIIPTRGYNAHLVKTLKSLSIQTKKPKEVILVSSKKIYNRFSLINKINLKVIYSKKANQIFQRNIGIKNLSKDTDILLQLDDRIVLNKDCLKELIYSWKNAHKDTIGIGLNIVDKKFKIISLNSLLNISGMKGQIPFFGLNFDYSNLIKDKYVSWIKGGASSWYLKKNKRIYEREFPNWKWCVFEDIDYCFGKKKNEKLLICSRSKAKILKPKKLSVNDSFHRGVINSLSIKMITKKYSKNYNITYLMNILLIIFGILKSVLTLNLLNFYFSLGRLKGIFKNI